MLKKGGFSFYGPVIGIIMMDTKFPRGIGDLGNSNTFSFPVRYKVLKNITASEISENSDLLLNKFIEAAQELENEGVKAITTCCGLAIAYQKEVSAAINIPFFASIYNLIPLIHSMIAPGKIIGLFHDIDRGTDDQTFNLAGWSKNDIPIARTFMTNDKLFARMIHEDVEIVDSDVIEEEIREMTRKFVEDVPNLGAIALVCTNYGQYSNIIQEVAKVPVFGMAQYVEFIASVVSVRN
jgi:hypothetical protein